MLDYGKVQQKTMLIAMTGSVLAGGINNTIDLAATAEGAEAFGNGNSISATATSALAAGYGLNIQTDQNKDPKYN